ncbi:hypothetical protein ACFL0W_01150 [Nanoarchaeota archaeon]
MANIKISKSPNPKIISSDDRHRGYRRFISRFIFFYVLIFAIVGYFHKNLEFFYYCIIFLVFILAIRHYQKKKREIILPLYIYIGVAVWGILHFLGGYLPVNEGVLYDVHLFVFGYDNLVHSFGMFVTTFMVYNLLRPHLSINIREHYGFLTAILLLMVLGVGSLVEIVEFSAVKLFNASGVGDYLNNAWDLVFNTIGSLVACFLIVMHQRRVKKKNG